MVCNVSCSRLCSYYVLSICALHYSVDDDDDDENEKGLRGEEDTWAELTWVPFSRPSPVQYVNIRY